MYNRLLVRETDVEQVKKDIRYHVLGLHIAGDLSKRQCEDIDLKVRDIVRKYDNCDEKILKILKTANEHDILDQLNEAYFELRSVRFKKYIYNFVINYIRDKPLERICDMCIMFIICLINNILHQFH